MGVDRLFYCILEHCYREKTKDKDWEWFDFPPVIAPYDVAVFPLMTKDGLDKKAEEVTEILRASGLDVAYRDSGSIGRRYARNDEIGVPYALTIDYDTLKDDTVTIRYRNDGKQERIKITDCDKIIKENIRKGKVTL
jgi:glycyl-tRNA synthetase